MYFIYRVSTQLENITTKLRYQGTDSPGGATYILICNIVIAT